MIEAIKTGNIREIPPDRIQPNPENPRLYFRSEELDSLLTSIKKYGIQVPLTVYEDDGQFFLIDGERRWRCAKKLNLKKIPALVQEKPNALDNLLLMFNIHALREQWDYITLATKLPRVIKLYSDAKGVNPNEIELSEITGLTRGQIRRCRLLLDLPEKYRELLLEELHQPKHKQKLSEDFLIEMERSLKTIQNRLPEVVNESNIDRIRDLLIDKYKNNIIRNVVDFRMLSKIATSIKNLGVDEEKAENALNTIFSENNVSIVSIFEEQFELRYEEKGFVSNLDSLLDYLEDFDEFTDNDTQIVEKLRVLREKIDRIINA
jgi:ParB/RepB/Spo0J family partition protein